MHPRHFTKHWPKLTTSGRHGREPTISEKDLTIQLHICSSSYLLVHVLAARLQSIRQRTGTRSHSIANRNRNRKPFFAKGYRRGNYFLTRLKYPRHNEMCFKLALVIWPGRRQSGRLRSKRGELIRDFHPIFVHAWHVRQVFCRKHLRRTLDKRLNIAGNPQNCRIFVYSKNVRLGFCQNPRWVCATSGYIYISSCRTLAGKMKVDEYNVRSYTQPMVRFGDIVRMYIRFTKVCELSL